MPKIYITRKESKDYSYFEEEHPGCVEAKVTEAVLEHLNKVQENYQEAQNLLKFEFEKNRLYVVRLYDGFDNIWMDVSKPTSREEAEKIWNEKTENGKKNTKFDDIDYYAIYPADTEMLFSVERTYRKDYA